MPKRHSSQVYLWCMLSEFDLNRPTVGRFFFGGRGEVWGHMNKISCDLDEMKEGCLFF